jgi:hypothetical protein
MVAAVDQAPISAPAPVHSSVDVTAVEVAPPKANAFVNVPAPAR